MMKRISHVLFAAVVMASLASCGALSGPAYVAFDGKGVAGFSTTPEDLENLPSPPSSGGSSDAASGSSAGAAQNAANAMAEGMNSMAESFTCGGSANAYAKGEGSHAVADATRCNG